LYKFSIQGEGGLCKEKGRFVSVRRKNLPANKDEFAGIRRKIICESIFYFDLI